MCKIRSFFKKYVPLLCYIYYYYTTIIIHYYHYYHYYVVSQIIKSKKKLCRERDLNTRSFHYRIA